MSLHIVTANRLIDGAVVYFTTDGHWSIWIAEAGSAETEPQAAALLAAAEASVETNDVIEPYLIDVRREAGTITPLRYREVIRAKGPTTHPHHGRDAGAVSAPSGNPAASAFMNGY